MELRDVEEILNLLDSCILRIKWRLRPSAKRRLGTDILALCTGLRAIVMVDYGGKMPELQDRLCNLMSLVRKECTILLPLRIFVIEDMIYIIHAEGHTELSILSLEQQLHFVDLEVDPPQLLFPTNENMAVSEFLSVQKLFLSIFPDDAFLNPLHRASPPAMFPKAELSLCKATNVACIADPAACQPCEIIDLTSCLKDAQITIPAVNGWLLGYPLVYLFRKEHATDAAYNLSTKNLHIYRIVIRRHHTPSRKPCEEELMSFSVPYDLSLGQDKEPWAEAFFTRLFAKFEKCRHIWSSIRLECSELCPQAIVL